ncbi:uncharacterized calcium-binding protein c800.10c [Phtheirospermum japonicum]|uniref:Uncharacterized calcium-binding protein c800.10c n=1 Tax=Phtheirospermum japonicum TaxID=374723 RepID=A0A830B544_9LAMI|nr:uncharacterized calcium-binding protein c800.10c [Phtheirospermum japonicum]
MAGAGGVNLEKFEEYFQRADLDRDGRISGVEAVTFLQGSNLPRQVLAQAALFGPASARIPPPQINVAATPVPQPNPVAASPLPQQMRPTTQPNPVAASPLPQQLRPTTQPPSQNFGFRGPTPPNTNANQQFGTVQSNIGMTQQFRPIPSSTGMNQPPGLAPSSSGVNQQFTQLQPATTMNQQYRQVQPTGTGMNRQFGQLQPPSTGMNQQFGQPPSSTNINQQFFPSQGNQIRPPVSMSSTPASHPSPAASRPNVSVSMAEDWLGGKIGPASTGTITQNNSVKEPSSSISRVASNPQDLLSTFSSTAVKDLKGPLSSGNGLTLDSMFSGDAFSANQSSSWKVSSAPQQPAISVPTSSAIVPVTSSSQPPDKPDPFQALQSTLIKPSNASQAAQTPSLPKSNQQAPTQVSSSVLSAGVQAGVGISTSEQPQVPWPKMTRAGIQKYARVFMEVDSDRDGKITGDEARNLFLSWRLPREVLKQVWDLSDQDSDSMLSLREFCIALYLMERYREGRPLPSTLPNSVMLDEALLSGVGPPTTYGSLRPQQGFHGTQPVTPAGLRPPMQPIVSHSDGSMQFNQKSTGGPFIDNSHANQLSNGEANSLDTKEQEAAETNEVVLPYLNSFLFCFTMGSSSRILNACELNGLHVDNKENVLLDSREKLEFYRTKMQDLVLYKSRCDNRLNEITERARADKNEAEILEKKYQEKYKQVAEIHSKLTIEEAAFREIQARKTELQQAITKMEQGGSADGILQVRADRIQSDLEELTKALTERCKKHTVEINSSSLIELPPGWQPGVPEIAAIWDEDWDKFEDEGFSFDVVVPENAKSQSDQIENSSPTRSLSPDSVSNAAAAEKLFAGAFDDESDPDHGKHDEKYFFGSNDFGASPDRNGSPQSDSPFQKNSPFNFEDSVAGSPRSRANNSPRYSVESRDQFFDNFSRFDSFSTHDRASSPRRENLSRFDSISSTSGFDHSNNYSFDDSDPFGSSGPFKVSSDVSPREKF